MPKLASLKLKKKKRKRPMPRPGSGHPQSPDQPRRSLSEVVLKAQTTHGSLAAFQTLPLKSRSYDLARQASSPKSPNTKAFREPWMAHICGMGRASEGTR